MKLSRDFVEVNITNLYHAEVSETFNLSYGIRGYERSPIRTLTIYNVNRPPVFKDYMTNTEKIYEWYLLEMGYALAVHLLKEDKVISKLNGVSCAVNSDDYILRTIIQGINKHYDE